MLTRVIRETVMPMAATLQVAVMFSSSLMATENWPNYRGPTEAGHVASSQLPLHWSEAENVVWKTEIKGKAWSSPVIWGERVFLTNAPEDGSRLSVVCLDKESGKVLYDKVLHSVALPQYCHPFNSYASPSPVVEEGRLYVSFGSPYNGCLDSETGEVIWERTDLVCNHFRGPGSSPFLYKDFLIIHFDGSDEQYVAAFKKETGETVWRTDRTVDYEDVDPETGKIEREGDWRKAFSTPIIAEVEGRDVLISLGSMAIYGYDPTNGEELWRVEFPRGHSGACRPVFAHGLVYTLTGAGQELWAIRPDGRGVVTDSHVVWKHERTAVPRRPSIVVVDDAIYMIDDAGVAGCLDAHTGKLIWKGRVGGEYSSSLLHAGDRIYCFNQEGKAAVMKTGRKFELLAESQLDEGFMASPAVSGNALYLRTRTHLYRIED